MLEYKNFCEDWNSRLQNNPEKLPEPSEFDQFSDLTESNEWTIEDVDATVHKVNAPLFLSGDEFTCRPWEFLHPEA